MENIEKVIKGVNYILLPPPFMTKGYIEGEGAPSCNYEEYLAELLDKTIYFRKRTEGTQIKLIEKQDHGESDICVNGFSLDFKLIGGQSAIMAQKLTSGRINHIREGAVAYGTASGQKEGYEAVRIHLAVRAYSCDELITLSNNFNKNDIIQRDVVRLLNNIETDKNLLLYLPYAIIVEENDDCDSYDIVKTVLADCFHSLLEYRNRMVPNKETFFCCLHNQQMLFYECKGNELLFIESVPTCSSESFCRLARYYDLKPGIIDTIVGSKNLWKMEK